MSNKPPSFEDAGKTPNKPKEVNKTDDNVNTIDDIVKAVINTPKEKPKRQVSVYLDEDVAKEFERFGKKRGKGAKSKLVNTFLKNALLKSDE